MSSVLLKLLPVIVAIFSFLLFRRLRLTLSLGSITAALLICKFDLFSTVKLIWNQLLEVSQVTSFFSYASFVEANRLHMLLFIFVLNIFIALLCKSGVILGYYNFLTKYVTSKKSAELSCLGLGGLLFIDDYLNVMMNSRVSTLFCHKFGISRKKIAFLITCLAAPLCTLIPISSWTAEIIAAISGALYRSPFLVNDGFAFLIRSLPFLFTSWLWIFMAISIVLFGYEFGEIAVMDEDDKNISSIEVEHFHSGNFRLFHFIIPIFILVASIIGTMFYFGGAFSSYDFFSALTMNPSPGKSLLVGTSIGLINLVFFLFLCGFLRIRLLASSFHEGFSEARGIIILLLLSNSLGQLIALLGTGDALASLISVFVSPQLFPAISFLIAAIFGFLLGSSWAAIAIMFPILLPTVFTYIPLLGLNLVEQLFAISIGSVLSGILVGSSLSPVNDLIVMNSKGCKVSHTSYLRVQFQNLTLIGIATFLGYLLSGYFLRYGFNNSLLSLSISLLVCNLLFYLFSFCISVK